ncbi:MAG: hypothetical protein ACTSUE_25220 [Promethearchaeota archaeon]
MLDYADGARAVATLPGSVMYTLGHYLRRLSVFEDLLIHECKKISRPLPYFVSNDIYIPKEYRLDPDDKYDAAQRGYTSVGLEHEEQRKEKERDIATLSEEDIEIGLMDNDDDEEEFENETQKQMEIRIEQERILHAAIQQRKIFRLVSQYPVQLSTPFVDEFYQRIVDEDSPYAIFDFGLIMVYRLWANTGSHQMFLIRAVREFLKAKDRLGPLWTLESLEPFLVCNLHTEYDMLHTDLTIEVQDYSYIEKRMTKRLHTELARITPVAPPPTKDNTITTAEISSDSRRDESTSVKPVKILEPEHEYDIPPEVYYMQQREELEIHRLARYHQRKITLLHNLYQNQSDFERVSNPFYERLHEIQRTNSQERMLAAIAPSPVAGFSEPRGRLRNPYSGIHSGGDGDKSTMGSVDGGTDNGERTRREQDLLQNVLESLVTAADDTREAWSEYQECTRKILIEVADLVRQVRQNQDEAKKMFEEAGTEGSSSSSSPLLVSPSSPLLVSPPSPLLVSPTSVLDNGKVPLSAESGTDDIESSSVGIGEDMESKKGHHTQMDVFNAKIVWGHGIPIVSEEGIPIGPYSPDRPHLPETTFQRLEYLLSEAKNSLICALGIDETLEE